MPCFQPHSCYQKVGGGITWHRSQSNGNPIAIPCGKCIGCRLDRAQDWATRLQHESRFHPDSIFLTLTYDNEHLPPSYTLVKRHVQLFMKSLRQKIAPVKIRFFAVGEYGDENLRPHYHLIIFGYRPSDAKQCREQKGKRFFRSDLLAKLWGRGFIEFGEVTPETVAYVARYSVKKIGGKKAEAHYTRVSPETGELHTVIPEFAIMSTRPGIGYRHYEKFRSDIYPHDVCIVKGHKKPVPPYYDKLEKKRDPENFLKIQDARRERSRTKEARWNRTEDRMQVREECTKARIKPAKRKL